MSAESPALRRALEATQHLTDAAPPWSEILKCSSDLMGSDGAAFVVFRDKNQLAELRQTGADAAAERDYASHFAPRDILLDHGPRRGPGTWLDTQALMTPFERERNEYYVDFMCRYRMRHIRCLIIEDQPERSVTLSFQSAAVRDDPHFLASEPIVRFQTAFRDALKRRQEQGYRWLASAELAFEAFGEAICLVDVSGKVLHASPMAGPMLESETALRLRNQSFWHPRSGIVDAIRASLTDVSRGGRRARVLVAGAAGKSCRLDIARADPRMRLDREPLLLVRIEPGHSQADVSLGALCTAYAITAAEGRVLAALVNGQTPKTFSQANDVSINTVRKQIAMLMEKTGCSRQVDLVRFALAAL